MGEGAEMARCRPATLPLMPTCNVFDGEEAALPDPGSLRSSLGLAPRPTVTNSGDGCSGCFLFLLTAVLTDLDVLLAAGAGVSPSAVLRRSLTRGVECSSCRSTYQ